MAGQLKASKEELDKFAKNAEAKHAQLMAEIRKVKAVEDQTSATWDGQAQMAFNSFMERYYVQADKLNDKLLETSEKLLKAGSTFESQDEEFASRVNNAVSSLDLPAV